MNGDEIKRIVDAIHRDKAIDKEIVFEGIEQAILSAARKHFSEEEELDCRIDRDTGEPSLTCDGAMLEPELIGDLLGRISAQTAKQVMIRLAIRCGCFCYRPSRTPRGTTKRNY